MRIKTISFLILVLLSSCSASPHWAFYMDNGNKVIYEKSLWSCYYEPVENHFYVECFEKSTGDMEIFYSDRVEDNN